MNNRINIVHFIVDLLVNLVLISAQCTIKSKININFLIALCFSIYYNAIKQKKKIKKKKKKKKIIKND